MWEHYDFCVFQKKVHTHTDLERNSGEKKIENNIKPLIMWPSVCIHGQRHVALTNAYNILWEVSGLCVRDGSLQLLLKKNCWAESRMNTLQSQESMQVCIRMCGCSEFCEKANMSGDIGFVWFSLFIFCSFPFPLLILCPHENDSLISVDVLHRVSLHKMLAWTKWIYSSPQ